MRHAEYLAATVVEALVLAAVILACVMIPASLAGVSLSPGRAARWVAWGAVLIVLAAWGKNVAERL